MDKKNPLSLHLCYDRSWRACEDGQRELVPSAFQTHILFHREEHVRKTHSLYHQGDYAIQHSKGTMSTEDNSD